MTTMPNQYYDRTDGSKEYERHLFVAGRGLQSAEVNEIQIHAANRLRGVADALFKDGGIVRDATVIVNPDTGFAQCAAGAIYILGAVRGVTPATFTIPTTGNIAIGIRLIESVVTSLEDPDLRDPATGTRNFGENGAERLKLHAQWGWDGDGVAGAFYPVYGVVDGVVTAKEPPPNLDAVTQALARYDRDSAGGSYVISGFAVSLMPDVGGDQVYNIGEGRARVYGYPIEYRTARRLPVTAVADLLNIVNEPHLSTTASAQRINLDRTPITNITQVAITAEKTVTLTHGVVTGAQDPLPDTSVLTLVEVKQGGATYTVNTDYKLTAGKVDWSPAGAEPSPGSTYTAKYRYITNVTPTAVDDTGFTVTGAVAGTLVLTDYSQKLPRIDRLCLDSEGQPVWLKGVPSSYLAQKPTVPPDLLPIASIYQTWTSARRVINDGVRVVTMPALASIDARFDAMLQLIAQQRLESSIHTREGGTKKGLFVDPFIDDSQRDAGTVQTAAVIAGELVMPITGVVSQVSADVTTRTTCAFTNATSLSQLSKTTSMKINPYLSFAPAPARVTLTPAVDRWTVVDTDWTSRETNRFWIGPWQSLSDIGRAGTEVVSAVATQRNVMIDSSTEMIETLRPISVSFRIEGFGPGETLSQVTFDGVSVTPLAP